MPTDVSTAPRNLLELAALRADELEALLDLGAAMHHHPLAWRHRLEGRVIACVLPPDALTVHAAFAAAIHRLGALPVMLEPGGAPDDDAHALSSSCAAIVVHGATQRHLREVAAQALVPVVNAGNRTHDPCRALAACLALREQYGTLHGLSIAYLGPVDGLVHSLLQAAPLAGFELRLSCLPDAMPDPWIIACAGRSVRFVDEPDAAVAHAHAVISHPHVAPGFRTPMAQALLQALITGDWEVARC